MPGALSNIQIDQFCASLPHYGGCFAKDQMPKKMEDLFYIINMQDSTGGGTHWVLLYNCNPHAVVYFDSYGQPPPKSIQAYMDRTHKFQQVNQQEIQQLNSDWCGYYCIVVARGLLQGAPFSGIISRGFSTNPNVNDKDISQWVKGGMEVSERRKRCRSSRADIIVSRSCRRRRQ